MFVFHGGALLAVASGVGLLALGIVAWRVAPSAAGRRPFAVFAALWGFAIATANLTNLVNEPQLAAPFAHLAILAHIPLYIPLLLVIAREGGFSGHWLLRLPGLALVLAPAAALFLLYFAAPALYVEDVVLAEGRISTQFGLLYSVVGLLEGTLIFVAGAVWASKQLARTTAEPRRSRLALLAAGFVTFSSYRASDVLRVATDLSAFASAGMVAVMAAATALAAALACAYAVVIALRDRTLPWRGLIVAGSIVPFLFGLSEIFFDQLGVVGFRTVGLWRLIAAGILAYGIARYRLFDAELRLSSAAPALAYVATAFVAIGLVWAFLGARLLSSPWLGGVATFGVALACVPAATIGRRVVERRGAHVGEVDYLYKRKVDVYRAALEDSSAHGIGQRTEQELLSNLRRALGISEQEHRILLLVIQSQEKYANKAANASNVTIADKFRVERELGRGAHGRALLAKDTALDRHVVLKQPTVPWLLDEEGRAKFVAEAKLAARITHPNVVAVYDVLAQTEPPTIVMEYVAGGSLDDKLRGAGRLPPAEVVRLGREMLAGLDAIHAAGMVHRDLKPANVLLDARGAAKIGDFGTAQPPAEWRAMATLGGTVGQPGTPAYMSPEQARGEDVDARADLYSVGAMLYRALTGEHYVDLRGQSEEGARRVIQHEMPRLPHPAVPDAMAKVLATALAKDRNARYASAAQMAADLGASG